MNLNKQGDTLSEGKSIPIHSLAPEATCHKIEWYRLVVSVSTTRRALKSSSSVGQGKVYSAFPHPPQAPFDLKKEPSISYPEFHCPCSPSETILDARSSSVPPRWVQHTFKLSLSCKICVLVSSVSFVVFSRTFFSVLLGNNHLFEDLKKIEIRKQSIFWPVSPQMTKSSDDQSQHFILSCSILLTIFCLWQRKHSQKIFRPGSQNTKIIFFFFFACFFFCVPFLSIVQVHRVPRPPPPRLPSSAQGLEPLRTELLGERQRSEHLERELATARGRDAEAVEAAQREWARERRLAEQALDLERHTVEQLKVPPLALRLTRSMGCPCQLFKIFYLLKKFCDVYECVYCIHNYKCIYNFIL